MIKLPLLLALMILWFAILTVACFLYTRAIHYTAYPMQSRVRTINIRPGLNKTTAEYLSRSRKNIKKYPSFEMCGNVLLCLLLDI